MIIVSDTSPISNLLVIGRLDLLESLYRELIIPPQVWTELMELGKFGFDLTLLQGAEWIEVKAPKDKSGSLTKTAKNSSWNPHKGSETLMRVSNRQNCQRTISL